MADRHRDEAESPESLPEREAPSFDVSRAARELPVLLLLALLAAFLIRAFVIQIFTVPSVSMRPTLESGDRVLVCEICGIFDDVDREDVIVFEDAGGEDFIKRVVGLPGDVVELHEGELFVNGEVIEEPYRSPVIDVSPYGPVRVPDGMLFVLGDNRTRSGDSRFEPPQGVGLVPLDRVVGEAVARIWPPDRIGGL